MKLLYSEMTINELDIKCQELQNMIENDSKISNSYLRRQITLMRSEIINRILKMDIKTQNQYYLDKMTDRDIENEIKILQRIRNGHIESDSSSDQIDKLTKYINWAYDELMKRKGLL